MTATQILPRDRNVTTLEALARTVAHLAGQGMDPAEAAGHVFARMATERPSLLARTLADMRANPEWTARFGDLIEAAP